MKNITCYIIIFCLLVSCGTSREEAIDELLKNHIIIGENVVDCKSFSGKSEFSAINKKTGTHIVTSQLEYEKFWNLQDVVRKQADVLDFDERFCLLIILEPSDYTEINFYKIIKGIDGVYYIYFIVDRKPLETEKKLFPFCVLNIPKIKGNVSIELIYVKETPHIGFTVKPSEVFGTMLLD